MRALCSGALAVWMSVPLARNVRIGIPLYPGQAGRAAAWVSPISSNASSKQPWAGPYSDPREARITGVNAGESRGPRQVSRQTRQQVTGLVALPRSTGAAL